MCEACVGSSCQEASRRVKTKAVRACEGERSREGWREGRGGGRGRRKEGERPVRHFSSATPRDGGLQSALADLHSPEDCGPPQVYRRM